MDKKDIEKLNQLAQMIYTEGTQGRTRVGTPEFVQILVDTPEFAQIKAEIGNPTGMPLSEFSDLAMAALKKAGANTNRMSYNKLFKIIGNALGEQIDYNKGEDGIGYVHADVEFDYN